MEAGSEDNMCLKKNRDAAGPQRLQRDAGSAQLVLPLHSMYVERMSIRGMSMGFYSRFLDIWNGF